MSFHPPGEGSVHREYLPAGTGVPAMTRSALVSNTVAWFAPVRHTWFQGATFPKITRPRVEGRLSLASTAWAVSAPRRHPGCRGPTSQKIARPRVGGRL